MRGQLKKEVKDLMGTKFRVIAQVFCVLGLTLSLGLATPVPAMAVEFPSISPATAQYNLDDPAEVMTTITWGIAGNIVAVSDDEGSLTAGMANDYIMLVKHLIILNAYLEDKLQDIGDSVELIIEFDVGAAAFTVTAIGTEPSISPTTAQYDLDDPDDVKTAVTWGTATEVESIVDGDGYTLLGSQYSVPDRDHLTSANLTIWSGAYLQGKLTDIGDDVALTINFDRGESATFTVTAIGTQPSIDPTTAEYDIDSPADVTTRITYGTADNVESITENGNDLTQGVDYTVGATVGGEATLTILDGYLEDELTDIGEEVVLTIEFDRGDDVTFEITAIGTNARVSPTAKNYDLDNPADVTTTITYGTAGEVESITENGIDLTQGVDYTVGATVGGEATLTILNGYLEDELTDIGEVVMLTIGFDLGSSATFTITAVGIQPRISPQTEDYDLDNPANVATTVTWGTATDVSSIVDDDNYMLIRDTDYTLPSGGDTTTLTILHEPYLKGKHMDIGEAVVLTIDFDVGTDAKFTITPLGVQPSIFPVTADHDVIDRNDVSTTITWGSAESVASIVDDSGYLLEEGVHYTVTSNTTLSSNLTILSSTYLASKLRSFGEKLVLTIGFDVGRDATLTVTVPEVCFIATAAYGTPMADEIEILRDFRDEYLLTYPLGQALVDVYYRVSPPIAEFIRDHPSLKPVVRAGLLPAVAMSAVAVNTAPVEKMVIVGLLVLVAAAAAVWTASQHVRIFVL